MDTSGDDVDVDMRRDDMESDTDSSDEEMEDVVRPLAQALFGGRSGPVYPAPFQAEDPPPTVQAPPPKTTMHGTNIAGGHPAETPRTWVDCSARDEDASCREQKKTTPSSSVRHPAQQPMASNRVVQNIATLSRILELRQTLCQLQEQVQFARVL